MSENSQAVNPEDVHIPNLVPNVFSTHNVMAISMLLRHDLIKMLFYQQNQETQARMLRDVLDNLNSMFGTTVVLDPDFQNAEGYAATGGGMYSGFDNTMYLYKPSLMTFLHCYVPALMRQGYMFDGNIAEIAHTLFFNMSPNMYFNAVDNGLFVHKNICLLDPFSRNGEMPAERQVWKDRHYNQFDAFAQRVLSGASDNFINAQLLEVIADGHASYTRHLEAVRTSFDDADA